MKTRIHMSLDRLLNDKHTGTKVSLFIPVKGDVPAHVLFAGLRDSAIRLLPDPAFAESFRRWVKQIREEREDHKNARTLACFFSDTLQEVIALDREIPSRVVVSQSWHVKPLLYAANSRPWGHIFEFNENGISLIRSDGETHELLETIVPPVNDLPSRYWHEELSRENLRSFVARAAQRISEGSLVQVSGAPEGAFRSPVFWQHFWDTVIIDETDPKTGLRKNHLEAFTKKLSTIKVEPDPEDIIRELAGMPAISDPALISRRILEGKIGRIYISLEAIQWGEIDRESGKLKKSRFQMNHVDDDILDDIAELALRNGVEVRILRQSSFPGKFEIIAA